MSLSDCKILELPKISDARGNLSYIEGGKHVPFDIRRVYYLYDVPGGTDRGSHGHWKLHQFVVAAAGSFDVVLDDGLERHRLAAVTHSGLSIPGYPAWPLRPSAP